MRIFVVTLWLLSVGTISVAQERLILQSTTSTQNSGLLDEILPQFTATTGIEVAVVAVGTGQALKNARNGDGDLVLVHARTLEDAFIADGWGVDRRNLMYNDFVVVGPANDPAGISEAENAEVGFGKIARSGATFLSRGDDSGTHLKELGIWKDAQLDPSHSSGEWYRETGSGMGTTLNIAVELDGYTITDRGTWISFGNKRDHRVLLEGDPKLFNPYGLIRVNPDRHTHVRSDAALELVEWLTGPQGQLAIANYRVEGQQLFFPNAVQ